ncbi:MAG: chloride channel protein [Gemmatimonadaceae bacterium]|nr:chloride channel protein [Chitinophagaceae bacterium]
MNYLREFYQSVVAGLRIRLNRVQYLVLMSIFVGMVSGLLSVILKTLVHYLQQWVGGFPYAIFFLIAGLLVSVFMVRHFFRGHLERGIAMVLKAVARKSSFIPVSHTYSHVVTSAFTVGLGGSVGLEAPIVATGAAVGSNIARINDFNYQERSLLIACGAAAGIAAVFNAPVAGVIFAMEVLLAETGVSYFIPLIISAVTGALCSRIILEESILFNFVLKQNFNYYNVPFYILLGVACGFVSLYYARVFKKTEHTIQQFQINPYLKAGVGGLLLVGICYLLPPLFGEGYETVKVLANGLPGPETDGETLSARMNENWKLLLFTGAVFLLKPLAAAITIGSGGNGGNFAPSLFAGSYLGFFFSRLGNTMQKWYLLPEGNFSLVGMAGLLSGVMYCPLTAIFLIAEITNGYGLFIPLMIVSSISYFIVRHYEPYSMDTKQLALEGQIFTHKKEENMLASMSLSELLQDKYESVSINASMHELSKIIQQSDRNIFAVHDNDERFVGIIELNDIKKELFMPERFDQIKIRQLYKKAAGVIYDDEDMNNVMKRLDLSGSWYLPVLTRKKVFKGFVSKTRVFNKYREILGQEKEIF